MTPFDRDSTIFALGIFDQGARILALTVFLGLVGCPSDDESSASSDVGVSLDTAGDATLDVGEDVSDVADTGSDAGNDSSEDVPDMAETANGDTGPEDASTDATSECVAAMPDEPCQTCVCENGAWDCTPVADDSPCDAGCELDGMCAAGQCQPTGGTPCDDENPCTTDTCSAGGECSHTPASDGTVCADGLGCLLDSTCSAGACAAGTSYTCDDGKACTIDECTGGGECDHSLIADTCDIDGSCVAAGESNPAEACETCDPSASTTAWTAVADCTSGFPIELPFTVAGTGFDVSDDGGSTVAGWAGNDVQALCFDAAGTKAGDVTLTGLLAQPDMGDSGVYVARADTTGQSVVVAFAWPSDNAATSQTAWWLDDECNVTGGPVHLQPLAQDLSGGVLEYFDVVMGDDGQTAIVFQSRPGADTGAYWPTLALFDGTGTAVNTPTQFGIDVCNQSGNGIRVAMRETTGDVIVSCQGHSWVPIHAQRFDATGAAIDDAMFMVNIDGGSAWYDSHQVGMGADGSFVVVWSDSGNNTLQGAFFDSSAAHIATVALGTADGGWYDIYRNVHARIQTFANGDYLIAGPYYQSDLKWIGRVDSTGGSVADLQLTEFPPLVRADADGDVYALPGGSQLVKNQSPWSF